METPHRPRVDLRQRGALKPSLVEWKPTGTVLPGTATAALKPSLVEWKPHPGHSPLWAFSSLETFLGGMETETVQGRGASPPACLETFLGGMETRHGSKGGSKCCSLETFLGGMETRSVALEIKRTPSSLKPSLVEWKPVYDGYAAKWRFSLKPSLVEWKHSVCWSPERHLFCIETFLGGMET